MKKLLSFTTIITAFICLLAFHSSASIVSEAKPIYLDNEVSFIFDGYSDEAIYSFTPSKTAYYELIVSNPIEDKTYITVYDHSGDEIGFAGVDDFSGECYCVEKLNAGETYYFEVSCFVFFDEEPEELQIILTTHSHDLKMTYIWEADFGFSGYYTQECSRCGYEKDTTIPRVDVTLSKTTFTYNGKEQKPTVTVKDTDGNILKNGTDFTVTYPSNSVNVDGYNLKVTLKKKYYNGSETFYYEIRPKSIEKMTVTLSSNTYTYDGKYKKPTVKISGLKYGTDYTCYYYDNLYTGVATVEIYGEGNYTGSTEKNFKIVPAKIKGFKAAKVSSTAVYLKWDNRSEDYGMQIYDMTAKKVIANIFGYRYDYMLKKLNPGTVYKFKIRETYKTSDGILLCGPWSDTLEFATNPAVPTIKSIKSAKSNTLSVTWDKQTSAAGYQLQYSTSSKFASNATKTIKISKNSQTSYNIAKLTGGKKYYVRIRSYKAVKINGKSTYIYSSWSAIKSATIKK